MDFYKNKNVLVTGGTGLIGRPLVELLLQAGANVRVASLDEVSRCPKGAEFVPGNLMHLDFCRQVVSGIDYVFHVAGVKGSVGIGVSRAASFFVPALMVNTNMMEAARQAGVKRYLFTSSVAVYPPAQVFREDDAWSGDPHPTDRYAAWAKRMGELQAETYKHEYGWDKIAIVRPLNVYGPWDNFDPETAMVIPALIERALSETPLRVWGDGSAIRDFIYSEDVARGMMLALEKGADCIPINLGSGRGISIGELVETILSQLLTPPTVFWDTTKETGEKAKIMDITRAREKLGFEPRISLKEGIKRTIDWYLTHRDEICLSSTRRFNVFRQGIPA